MFEFIISAATFCNVLDSKDVIMFWVSSSSSFFGKDRPPLEFDFKANYAEK